GDLAQKRCELTVTAGEQPVPTWRLGPGTRVTLELQEPANAPPLHVFDLRVYDDGGLVHLWTGYGCTSERERTRSDVILAPGSYRAEVETDTGLRGTLTFKVEAAGGPPQPVAIDVRGGGYRLSTGPPAPRYRDRIGSSSPDS